MTDKKPKYQTNTNDSVQQIIKIKESLKKNNTGTNYKAVRDILQKVDYNNEALEKDEWFLDLIIAKIRSDNHKPTFEFIMSIVYGLLGALSALFMSKNILWVFGGAVVFLIWLAWNGAKTDFQNNMLLEILTMIKNSGKIYEAIE